jgi:hypothetical protein
MMGQQSLTESLFYYFRLEDQIPADHLLRLINGYVDFSAHVGPWNQRTAFDVRSGLLYCWAIRRWHIEVYRQAVILLASALVSHAGQVQRVGVLTDFV